MHKGFLILLLGLFWATPVLADTDCLSESEKPVKIEAWMSKRWAPQYRQMRREFRSMGNTYIAIWYYPAENPSRVVAIGRCVPVYIAQHALERILHYYGEVKSLVHQGFVSPHWIGLATSLFSEQSQQPITREQLDRLLDPSLDTPSFQALYRKYTVQDETVHAFGQDVPNPKLMSRSN